MARIKPQALLQQTKRKKEPARFSLVALISYSLLAILVIYVVFSVYRNWSQRPEAQTSNRRLLLEKNTLANTETSNLPRYAVLSTVNGPVTIQLFRNNASAIVGDFIKLCRKGQLEKMPIWHVRKPRTILEGKIAEPDNANVLDPIVKHLNQLDLSSTHDSFVLGTPKAKDDARGFQFFITSSQISGLNKSLIILGRVIAGARVIQGIDEVSSNENYRPRSLIQVRGISLHNEI